MTIHFTIRREGKGWDTYPSRGFIFQTAVVEWADTVGPMFLDTLREECPVNTRAHFTNAGRLRDSLRSERHTGQNTLRLQYTANTPYAEYILTGVRPHLMEPRNFPFMHWWDRPVEGTEYIGYRVMHGSRHPQTANRYHERAFERDHTTIEQKFVDIMTDHLKRGLEE